jgi:hypothetical protein
LLLVALGSCARPKPASVQIDPALSILIPPDTNLVVAVRLEALRKTTLYQKYASGARLPPLEELGKYTGIDARKDLWEALFLSDGKRSVLLGRGNFAGDMESKLERDGAKVMPHKMYHIVGQEDAAVVFFNSTTAAVGDAASLRALLDARGGTKGPPAAIAARMQEIPPDAQLWAVSTVGGRSLAPGLPGNLANLDKLAALVDSGLVYFDFRDGIKGRARSTGSSGENAKQLHDALKGLIGLGRLAAPPNQPEMLHLLDGVHVTQEANAVDLKIEAPADLIEKLASRYGR